MQWANQWTAFADGSHAKSQFGRKSFEVEMARRPKPIEHRIGEGNRSRRPLPKAPARVYGAPPPPRHFRGYALQAWRDFSKILRARGQLSKESGIALEALCACFAEWHELADDIRKHGRFQTVAVASSGAKVERPRPAVAALRDADRRLKGWLIEFGLTDASRGKVHTGGFSVPDETRDEEPLDDDPIARYGLN